MSEDPTRSASGGGAIPSEGQPGAPSEEELRAAYEAELSRINVIDMIAQSAVSLLNMAARRLAPAPDAQGAEGQGTGASAGSRDLEQARDAIDAARALLEILERRIPEEVRSLRDALSQLQMAYAAEVRAAGAEAPAGSSGGGEPGDQGGGEPAGPGGGQQESGGGGAGSAGSAPGSLSEADQQRGPGPAESSGRLWVPGR
ncbi:MAG TPA: hypothetical protein VKG82_10270 [Solirubrobacteraceae bacterium]|nr:hypothetical protein [Solirubrobacteraceae bacterium]